MTQEEKLLLRIAAEKGKAITVTVLVGEDGKPLAWIVEDSKKIEGNKKESQEK